MESEESREFRIMSHQLDWVRVAEAGAVVQTRVVREAREEMVVVLSYSQRLIFQLQLIFTLEEMQDQRVVT